MPARKKTNVNTTRKRKGKAGGTTKSDRAGDSKHESGGRTDEEILDDYYYTARNPGALRSLSTLKYKIVTKTSFQTRSQVS